MEIFSKEAPRYWARGLSVIPLLFHAKKPFQDGWQTWHDMLPSEAERQKWVDTYHSNNIGLVLGRQSGVTVVDIDTLDKAVEDVILAALPKSPWHRVGAKGRVLAFKYNGKNTFRIKDKYNKTVVEVLSTGSQVVLPPSIHPDTQLPYTATADLVDVYDQLLALPDDLEEVLRAHLATVVELGEGSKSKFRISEYVPLGARDTQMNRHAGLESYAVLRGEISVKQALSNMRAWIESNVQKVDGDGLDEEKGCRQIIQYIVNDVNSKGKILPPGWDEGLTDEEKKGLGLSFDESQEEWTVEQLLDYVHKNLEGLNETDPKKMIVVEFVLKKISKSVHLSSLEEQQVLNLLKAGTNFNASDFKKRLNELRRGPIQGLNHTEIAQAVVREFENKNYTIRFHNDDFWSWGGSNWKVMPEHEIWEVIAKEFGELPAATRSNDHKGIMKVMSNIVERKIKKVNLNGVNFANGFLTEDLKMLPHSMDFGMTYTLPFCYKPELAGKAGRFNGFLSDCWSHNADFEDRCRALQEAIAVTLFGMGPAFQRAILLYGVGHSGKSQMLEIISHMVPDDAKSAIPPQGWDQTFLTSFLDNKLLNVAGELAEKTPIPGKTFKEVISGDEITGQHKFKAPFNFRPKATHWFASNFLPVSRDASNGFNRRWLIFSFDKPCDLGKSVVNLGQKIVQEEIEAIVAWAIEAVPALIRRGGYTLCASHEEIANEMSLQNSVIRQWMAERVSSSVGARVKQRDLYKDYWNYCTAKLMPPRTNPKQFGIDLDQFLAEARMKETVMVEGELHYMNLKLNPKANEL